MLCYYCTEYDPYINLSLEHTLFLRQLSEPILLIYRCKPTVVIGRNQNPWNEVDFRYIKKKKIEFMRRESGGGTVYHDLGNINFSFIVPRTHYSIERNLTILVRALHRLGVKAKYTAHNDILVEGRKVSGSAFRYRKTHALHHGTLLCNSHLKQLRNSINPPGIVKDGVMVFSRPSSVANMRQYAPINANIIMQACSQELQHTSYFPAYQNKEYSFTPLHHSLLSQRWHDVFKGTHNQLRSWQWRVAKTAPCQLSFSHQQYYLDIKVDTGHIVHVKVRCACTHQQEIEKICTDAFANTAFNQHLLKKISHARSMLRHLLTYNRQAYHRMAMLFKLLSENIPE